MGISAVSSSLSGFNPHAPKAGPGSGVSATAVGKQLSEEEQRLVQELKKRDTEVKSHEAAHVAAGGQYVKGGASYTYQAGPDGKRYAVGGEVSIDTSPVPGDPEATIAKMRVIKRAALAPANPSGADHAVAAQAASAELKAQQQLTEKKSEAAKEAFRGDSKEIPQAEEMYQEPPSGFARTAADTYSDNSTLPSNKKNNSDIVSLLDLSA